jgi:hypothetical protein
MRRRWVIVGLAVLALVVAGVWWALTPRSLTAEDRQLLREGISLAEAERALGRPPDLDETHRPDLYDTAARVGAGFDPTRTAAWRTADGWIIVGMDTGGRRIFNVSYTNNKDFFHRPGH